MNVRDAMTSEVQSCPRQANLEEVARMMWDNDVGSIPIVAEDNRPVGIVTDRDIAMCAMHNHKPLWEIQASQLIENQRLCSCGENESIQGCLEKMEQNEIRRMLVTRDDGSLCGIISMGDIVAFTGPNGRGRRQQQDAIPPDNTLELLKNVSAHHAAGARPSASM